MTGSAGDPTPLRFVLASASPARLETLRRAGLEPDVIVSGVDEDGITVASTAELVVRLAELKAQAVATQVVGAALVLGCDSLLDLDGEALGKPGSQDAARVRWRQMRGRSGVLHTGHCLIDTATGRSVTTGAATTVHFADATDAEIELYCSTGEPVAVAGAFTIDGLGGWFIDGVEGDPHTVVGVSLPTLRRMLGQLGRTLADLGYPAPRR